jgi:hypothetical protein
MATFQDVLTLMQKHQPKPPVMPLPWINEGKIVLHKVMNRLEVMNCPDIDPALGMLVASGQLKATDVSGELQATLHKARLKNEHYLSLLHLAVICGQPETVRVLLQAGMYVDLGDAMNNTPLYYAVTHPGMENNCLAKDEALRTDIVGILLEYGANPLRPGPKHTPIEMAIKRKLSVVHQRLILDGEYLNLMEKLMSSRRFHGAVKKMQADYRTVYWTATTALWAQLDPEKRHLGLPAFQPDLTVFEQTTDPELMYRTAAETQHQLTEAICEYLTNQG